MKPGSTSTDRPPTQSPDLTKLPHAAAGLRRLHTNDTLLGALLETVTDVVLVVDAHETILAASASASQLFGYSAAECTGQDLRRFWTAPSHERGESALQNYQAAGEQVFVGTGRHKDGRQFPMEMSLARNASPSPDLFVICARHLGEGDEREFQLRSARDAAQRANRAKSRFLAGMSHELRTPLNGLLGYARLLKMEGGLNETQAKRVEAMLGAGAHLLQMISCVLDLSEIEVEHVEMHAEATDVRAAASACLDVVRPAAEAKKLDLHISIAQDVPASLVTDPMRFRQILLNLLGNAVKYTSTGRIELRIAAVTHTAQLRVDVRDTGPGITDDQRARLFEEFARCDATGESVEGAGLGLAISARLAGLIGGRIGHDHHAGGGSVFWLEIPLDEAVSSLTAPPRLAAGPAPRPAPAARALRVLVVDDVMMNRDIAASFLRVAQHEVICAESGQDAVDAVASKDFDVVLMDVRMPGMDGLEATRRIRSLAGTRARVPIVALTAQAFSGQVADCRKAGMNSHLSKPFDPETLLAAVLRAAEKEPTGGQGETVLVVEDNAAMRRAVVRQLALLDYRTLEAGDAKAAVALLERESVSLVFTDVVMAGGMDGFALADEVGRRWPDVKILLTSGFPAGRDDHSAPGLKGAIRILGKPYGREQLASAVRETLESVAAPVPVVHRTRPPQPASASGMIS